MARHTHPTWLVPVSQFVNEDLATQQRLLELAARLLSPYTLVALETSIYACIDLRYPDDPGSLLNLRYREGQRQKRAIRRLFDQAYLDLAQQQIAFLAQGRAKVFDDQLTGMADALYGRRRAASVQRQEDTLAHTIRAGLADNPDLQAELARADQAHRFQSAAAAQQHEQTVGLRQVEAEIQRAQRLLDRPHELQLKLYDVLAVMSQYQMTLADRATRNPALADRLRMMSVGMTAVMASIQGLIAELDAMGPYQPTPEQTREQQAQLLAMALEQMQQWQQETRQEASA